MKSVREREIAYGLSHVRLQGRNKEQTEQNRNGLPDAEINLVGAGGGGVTQGTGSGDTLTHEVMGGRGTDGGDHVVSLRMPGHCVVRRRQHDLGCRFRGDLEEGQ